MPPKSWDLPINHWRGKPSQRARRPIPEKHYLNWSSFSPGNSNFWVDDKIYPGHKPWTWTWQHTTPATCEHLPPMPSLLWISSIAIILHKHSFYSCIKSRMWANGSTLICPGTSLPTRFKCPKDWRRASWNEYHVCGLGMALFPLGVCSLTNKAYEILLTHISIFKT